MHSSSLALAKACFIMIYYIKPRPATTANRRVEVTPEVTRKSGRTKHARVGTWHVRQLNLLELPFDHPLMEWPHAEGTVDKVIDRSLQSSCSKAFYARAFYSFTSCGFMPPRDHIMDQTT